MNEMEKVGDIVYIYPGVSRQYTKYYLCRVGENVEKCIKLQLVYKNHYANVYEYR